MRLPALAVLFLSLASIAIAQAGSQVSPQINPPWGYEGKIGPVFWSKISPANAACSKGFEQSPIDIRNARLDTALQPIEFHYLGGPVTLTNTGNTVQVSVDPGSYMIANGVRYELLYYEFHHPGEHTVRNRLFDMEVDLVHRGADGKDAILGVFLSEGQGFANATLAALWEHLPTRPGESERITDMVDAAGLLPADRGYWTYTGSLPEPPCTEGVQWYVFEQPVSISRSQYNAFSALYRFNIRPTQDLRGRKIQGDE